MTPDLMLRLAIRPALTLLPSGMNSREAIGEYCGKIGGADACNQHATTPDQHPAIGGRTAMAKQKSTAISTCPECGEQRELKERRRLNMRCLRCAKRAQRQAMGRPEPSVMIPGLGARYSRTCGGCGRVELVEWKHLHHDCRRCVSSRRSITHGLSRPTIGQHPLYRVIKSAKARCNCPGVKDYQWYGALGVSVCEEWSRDAAVFVAWAMANGYAPGLELDRTNPFGNYEPSNCRFVTHAVNCGNKRKAWKQ